MRRFTIEFPESELSKFHGSVDFSKVEWFEVLRFLEVKEEVAVIARVKFKDRSTRVEGLFGGLPGIRPRFLLLGRENGDAFTYFGRFELRPEEGKSGLANLFAAKGYLSVPFELRNGKLTITYLGRMAELRWFRNLIDKTGARYRVVALEAARDLWKPRETRLTEKQRGAITLAYRMGYYDVPKESSIEQLARIAQLAPSTLDVELRRGEKRLLSDVVQ